MLTKASTSGKVYDKMDKLCVYLLAYEPNCPAKYRQSLWLPLRRYIDEAQACAEMAYLEPNGREKFDLIKDSRKYFRVFKRYHSRCEMTGEFRFGRVGSLDMLEVIEDIEGALGRWYASQRKLLVSGGAELNPHKFKICHWSQGFRYLGVIIDKDKAYPSGKVVGKAYGKIYHFNRVSRDLAMRYPEGGAPEVDIKF